MTTPKGRDLKKIISTVLFIALIAVLCIYVYDNREDMKKLIELERSTIARLLLLALGGCIMNCVYHRVILSTYRIPLSLVDWMGVVFVSNAMAYVLPMRADLLFSAAYYKRTKGLAYVKSVSMAAGNIVFGVIFALLQMLIALLCTGLIDGVWSSMLWLIWSIGAAGTITFIFISLFFGDKKPAFLTKYKLVSDVVDGFNALLKNRSLLWQLLLCLTINNIVQLFLYMVCFEAIGIEVMFYEAMFYNSVSWLSSIVAIVPGNIGIKEGMMGIAMQLMGMSFPDGVALSLLHRVAVMIVYMVMGLVFAFPVWRNWNKGNNMTA
ncbi:MAG: flippase-like domain-containing protein [Clostridiales bacterium]|nr:flippase-like domain-containing protein [Clostridiales bacterium]